MSVGGTRRIGDTSGSQILALNYGLHSRPRWSWGLKPQDFWDRGFECRSQWSSGLRRESAADCLLWLRVCIPPGGMDVSVVCCREISDRRTEDIKVHNGVKRQNERKKRKNEQKIVPLRVWTSVPCLFCVSCRWRHLRRADHSFREILPFVCVCSTSLNDKVA